MPPRKKHPGKSRRKTVPRARAPKPTGRPPLDISEETIEGMAWGGASMELVAEYLRVDVSTIKRRFATIFQKHAAHKKIKLTQAQFRSAIGTPARVIEGVVQPAIIPNVTAQIWLGKQWLKQSDKVETPVDEQGDEIPRQRIRVGKDWIEF